jgi:phosphate starvation-inducible PhoH-like protein
MIEKTIYLEGIDPIDFFGVNNSRFERLKIFFPKLKIMSRGNLVMVKGEQSEIDKFEDKIDIIVEMVNRFPDISIGDFDELLTTEGLKYYQ